MKIIFNSTSDDIQISIGGAEDPFNRNTLTRLVVVELEDPQTEDSIEATGLESDELFITEVHCLGQNLGGGTSHRFYRKEGNIYLDTHTIQEGTQKIGNLEVTISSSIER